MNILTEIVGLLSDNDNSLTSSLYKIKILASRMENKPLLDWIDKELSGYKTDVNLPTYRVYNCNVIGSFINGRIKCTEHILEIDGLSKKLKKYLAEFTFYESVSVIESYNKKSVDLKLSVPIEPVYLRSIQDNYIRMGNPYINIYSGYKQIGSGAIKQLLSEVRNKSLDLLLALESEFGYEINMEELLRIKEDVNNKINQVMNTTIINNGPGGVVNTGDNNSITSEISLKESSFDDLRNLLKNNSVENEDINELEKAIIEEPDYEKKLFGPKVNKWLKGMMQKSLDGSWKVGIGAAGSLLAEIIKKYYGM